MCFIRFLQYTEPVILNNTCGLLACLMWESNCTFVLIFQSSYRPGQAIRAPGDCG